MKNIEIHGGSDYKQFEEKRWTGRDQKLVFRHRAAYELLIKSSSTSFLDIGCGDGLFESYVKAKDKKIACTGIDFANAAIETAKAKNIDANFILADVASEEIPFSDNTFDSVIALDVLEHQFAPQDLLHEMKRVTKKYVIVGIPNFSSLPARIQMMCGMVPENNRPKKGHVYWFNKATLEKLMTNAGFTIIDIRMNYQLERYPIVGSCMKFFTSLFPALLALSFVVLAEKK